MDSNDLFPHKIRELRLPFGRFAFTRDKGDVNAFGPLFGTSAFSSRLEGVHHKADGGKPDYYDWGSGLTTQSLSLALIQELVSNTNAATMAQLKYMQSGTGATAAAYTDFALQTATTSTSQSGGFTTSITPTYAVADNGASKNQYFNLIYTGTLNYTGSVSVTEWGLFAGNVTPPTGFTNTSADTFTASSATPTVSQTWTAHAYAGITVAQVAAATSTIGFVVDNSATALNIGPAWVYASSTVSGSPATTPSSNTALTLLPLMADHKVFASVGVGSGDSIAFTYTLTCQSGN